MDNEARTMTWKCAWCGTRLDFPDEDEGLRHVVSHGVCQRCAFRLGAQLGMPLSEYLDGLEAPIVLVGGGGDVRGANARARALLGKELPQIVGRLGGEVFECRHATLPEGCGRTVHCSGCAIRRTVTDTYATGRAHLSEPASLDQGTPEEPTHAELRISTERVSDVVLLRIDELERGLPGGRS